MSEDTKRQVHLALSICSAYEAATCICLTNWRTQHKRTDFVLIGKPSPTAAPLQELAKLSELRSSTCEHENSASQGAFSDQTASTIQSLVQMPLSDFRAKAMMYHAMRTQPPTPPASSWEQTKFKHRRFQQACEQGGPHVLKSKISQP